MNLSPLNFVRTTLDHIYFDHLTKFGDRARRQLRIHVELNDDSRRSTQTQTQTSGGKVGASVEGGPDVPALTEEGGRRITVVASPGGGNSTVFGGGGVGGDRATSSWP